MSEMLEKVDEVISRTNTSYSEAKEALEFTDGDVLEAVIYIEQMRRAKSKKDKFSEDLSDKGSEVISKLKELIKMGQVTRILLKREGKLVLDIPVVAGAVGALIFTGATAVGILAALATGCDLYIVKDDEELVDIREILEDTAETVKEKAEDVMKHFSKEKTEDNKKAQEAGKEFSENEEPYQNNGFEKETDEKKQEKVDWK